MASNNKAFVRDVKKFLKRNSMILVALFILVVALSIFTNTFLTKDNLLWVYLWDIPFDKTTLLGKHGFNTTGWANCDVIPAGSYVDCEFVEFIPEYLRIAEYCQDKELAIVARIVTRGMQHGLSMPQNMYGYAMPGVQCEGYMTSLWLADTEYKGFSGAAAKNKGDDNDTSNGLVNGQALLNLDSLERTYGTLDFDEIFRQVIKN